MAWNSFHHAIIRIKKAEAEKAAQKRQMKRVMLKMLHAVLSLGWRGWHSFVENHLAAELERKRQLQVMRSVMLKMMKRQLSCGWTAWCDVILGIHRQRHRPGAACAALLARAGPVPVATALRAGRRRAARGRAADGGALRRHGRQPRRRSPP